jgi:hypothetical protein
VPGVSQCDEIWSFCYAKSNNVPVEKRGHFGFGDVWTWTALCADTKLVPCWMVAGRDSVAAFMFTQDLAGRLKNRIQPGAPATVSYLGLLTLRFQGIGPQNPILP